MRDLGYKDLKVTMNKESYDAEIDSLNYMTIRFQENLPFDIPKTEDENGDELAKFVQNTNDTISFQEGLFFDVFPNIKDDLESTYVLTQNLFDFLYKTQEKDCSSLNEEFIKYIFSESATYSNIESILVNIESFLNRLALLTCKNENRKKVQSLKLLFKLIDIEDYIKNEKPLVDRDIPHFKNLATTLRIYRNKNVHDNSSLKYYISQVPKGEAKIVRETIRDSVACFVMMVVWSHFDEIYDIISDQDISLSHISPEFESYVKQLQKDQANELNKIYDINEINEVGLESISNISLKPYNHEGKSVNDETRVLLAGESGTGKSTRIREMVYWDCQRWIKDKSISMPIMIEIKDYTAEYKDHFFLFIVNMIKKELEKYYENSIDYIKTDYIHNQLRRLFDQGKITLYIDGLNELSAKLGEIRNDVIIGLFKLSDKFNKCRYIITSRIKDIGLDEEDGEGVYGRLIKDGTIGNFKRYDLQPFEKPQIEEQIGRYLKAKNGILIEKQRKKIAGYIKNSKIEELARNPLQLILIIKHFNQSRNNNPLLVSNRSQLLIELTKEITKHEKVKNPSNDKLKKINIEIKKILLKIADSQYQNKDNQGLSICEIESLYYEVNDKSVDSKWTVELMLDLTITFGILEKKNDIYNFRHDSWREHFQAYNIAMELNKKLEANESPDEILKNIWTHTSEFKDKEVMDLLRHIFEIMEMEILVNNRNTSTKKIECYKQSREKVKEEIAKINNDEEFKQYLIGDYNRNRLSKLQSMESYVEKLQKEYKDIELKITEEEETYLTSTFNNRKFLNILAKCLMRYNNGLKMLTYATATMDSFDLDNLDAIYPLPKTVVEQKIMSMMSRYQKNHLDGISSSKDFKTDFNTDLKPIYEYTALSGNGNLLRQLFELYWLEIWLSIWTEEEVDGIKNKQNVLSGVLIANCENQLSLFYWIFDAYKKLCELGKISAANKVERLMMRLITNMNDGDAMDIIEDFLNKNTKDLIEYAHKRRIGPKLLLGLNDANSIFKALSMLKDYKFDTTIHLLTVENLLKKFKDPRMQAFLIGSSEREGLIETLPQGDEDHLMILNFLFLRYKDIDKEYKKSFRKYLESEKGQSVVSMHHELLDLLALEEVPDVYRNHYDLINYNTEDGFYKTDQVNYTLFRKDISNNGCVYAIAIPKPQDDNIATYDIEFIADTDSEKEKVCSCNYTIEEQKSHNRTLLLIKWTAEKTFHIKVEGKIRLTKDHCVMLLSFKNLKDLVWLNHPERYHNSICDRLINECNDYEDFNEMFYFFKEKSCLSLYMDEYYKRFIKQSPFHNWDIGIIDYCAILSKDRHQIRIFSPLHSTILKMYSTGIFNKVFFRKGAISTYYDFLDDYSHEDFERYFQDNSPKTVSFKILEKNGILSPINNRILNFDNKHLFGFITGYVSCDNNNYLITVERLKIITYKENKKVPKPLTFEFDNIKLKLKENDKVLFFPTIQFTNDGEIYKAEEVEII